MGKKAANMASPRIHVNPLLAWGDAATTQAHVPSAWSFRRRATVAAAALALMLFGAAVSIAVVQPWQPASGSATAEVLSSEPDGSGKARRSGSEAPCTSEVATEKLKAAKDALEGAEKLKSKKEELQGAEKARDRARRREKEALKDLAKVKRQLSRAQDEVKKLKSMLEAGSKRQCTCHVRCPNADEQPLCVRDWKGNLTLNVPEANTTWTDES